MKNRPAFMAALFLSTGIISARYVVIPFSNTFIFCSSVIFFTLGAFLIYKNSPILIYLLALSLACLGFLRYSTISQLLPPGHYIYVNPFSKSVTLTGYLIKDPTEKLSTTELLLESESITTSNMTRTARGKILVSFIKDSKISRMFKYGDEIVVNGEIERPRGRRNPGGFNYREYLELKGIYAVLKVDKKTQIEATGRLKGNPFLRKLVYPVRRSIMTTIKQMIHGESRSLLQALLIGEQGTISPEVREGFTKIGIVHILSVSGSHVGFIFVILTTFYSLLRLPRRSGIFFIILGLTFYAYLTEANSPIVRATIMAVAYLIGLLLERKTDPFNTVGVAAFFILLLSPQDLFDIGFQLSFTSVLSIIYFYMKLKTLPITQKLERRVSNSSIASSIMVTFLVSLAAQIGTLPFIAVYFNQVPLISTFANILAIPLSGIIVTLGLISLLFAPFHFWTASVYGSLNQTLLSVFIKTASWAGNLPFSSIHVPRPGALDMFLYFSFLFFLIHSQSLRIRKYLFFLMMILTNIMVYKSAFQSDSQKMTWIQFDVGQGDAAIFHLPRGKNILIDCGTRMPYSNSGERVITPYLRTKGINKLDAVILTHPHNDHLGGMITILDHFHVGKVIIPNIQFDSVLYQEFLKAIRDKNIPLKTITAPDSLTEFPAVKFLFLSPTRENKSDEINDQSLIIRILFGKTKWLLMGDAGLESEEDLIAAKIPIRCDVLKVGHHGYRFSATTPFLDRIKTRYAVISVGEHNSFGHPSDEVIKRLRAAGVKIIRTDVAGAVIFESDGKTIQERDFLQ